MGTGKVRLTTLLASIAAVVLVDITVSSLGFYSAYCYCIRLAFVRAIQAASVMVVVLIFQKGMPDIGLARANMAGGIAAGIRWSVVFGGIVAFAGVAVTAFGIDVRNFFFIRFPGTFYCTAIYIATGVVIAPVCEELLFRGVIYGFFRRYGATAGIVVSTVVFALMHAGTAGALPVVQTIGGVLFCLAYEKEKSLFAPIIIHALGNAAIFALALLR